MSKFKNAVRVGIGALVATSVALTAVGCGGGGSGITPQVNDPETKPLVLSTNAPDGVFNPFYSSSTVDSDILSMTQISFLSADKDGQIVCGENEPSVALDYSVRESETKKNGRPEFTTYQFIIKKGIQFSDGVELTIKDVLFNLYVYLDYAYTGSATMYSTDIVGLNAYRYNQEGIGDNTAEAKEQEYLKKAEKNIDDLIAAVEYWGDPNASNKPSNPPKDYSKEQAEKDFAKVSEEFSKELNTLYNDCSATLDSLKENQGFEAAWQAFLAFYAGADLIKTKPGSSEPATDSNGNVIYDKDKGNQFLKDNEMTGANAEELKEWALGYAYSTYLGDSIKETYSDYFKSVIYGFETGTTVRDYFKTVIAGQDSAGEHVKSISGITAEKGGQFITTEGTTGTYDNTYDMLQIKVNGVDPKAIYNFAFIVAPMHYYSSKDWTNPETGEHVNYEEFNAEAGNFGVAYRDPDFMTQVIKNEAKIGIPVGAGVYKALEGTKSSILGGDSVIRLERNTYFETVGSGLHNAYIKELRYQVIDSDQIITSLNKGTILFGEPNATDTNEKLLNKNIGRDKVATNGYGYVGINPRFVPDINVRRAIMKAMDVNGKIINEYYRGNYAEIIYRSMSKESWAYPDSARTYVSKDNGTSYAFEKDAKKIQAVLDLCLKENGGDYTVGNDGIYVDSKGNKLKFDFTIAGGSKDHPAYNMFLKAEEILNNQCHGIKVNVTTNPNALGDLSSGKLAVWAAAWTSSIDPDMYQVYHKDSQASSVRNWGYPEIKNDKKTFAYEWSIIEQLSTVIDEARQTTDQDERATRYSNALDLVMELAVELPTYQRNDLFAYNANIIDPSTLQQGKQLTSYNGPLARIWEVNYYLSLDEE